MMKVRSVDLVIKARPEDPSSRDYPIIEIKANDEILNPRLEQEGIFNADYEDIFNQIEESIKSNNPEEMPQLHNVTYPIGKFIFWVKIGVAGGKRVKFLMAVKVVDGDDGKKLVIGEITDVSGEKK
jgi:hypothetical protein